MSALALTALLLTPQLAAVAPDEAAQQSEPPAEDAEEHSYPEATPYTPNADAMAAVDSALGRAAIRGVNTIIVIGGNWCHDSRALAGWLLSPEFSGLFARYEMVFVDSGVPQIDDFHNAEVNQRFGLETQQGTPLMMVVSPDGELLNSEEDAHSWRNSASRDGAEILAYFEDFEATTATQ